MSQISDLQAQAQQASAQGQQLLSQDQSQAAQYKGQYDTATQQAQQANQNLQQYTQYMQGAGNPLNLYNQGISQAEQAQGFDPKSLATATQNLTQTQNQLQNVANASNSSTGGYGLSGSQLGAYYGSLSQPLQQAAGAQNTAVGNLQQLYQNALTQGQQGAALGFQGEQQTSQNLNAIYQNAQNQASQYMSQMQFFSQLAQQQGGLNAQQQQYYAQSVAGLQQAQAAMTQAQAAANLANTQAAQIQQAINAANKQAAVSSSISTPTANKSSAPAKNSGGGMSLNTFNPKNVVQSYSNPFGSASNFGKDVGLTALLPFSGAGWALSKL